MQRMEKYSRRRYHKNDSAYLCTEMASQSESPYAKKNPVAHAQFLDGRGRSSKWNNASCNSLTATARTGLLANLLRGRVDKVKSESQ